jgi:hypothetical protein
LNFHERTDILSFRERTVVLILLLVARIFTDDPAMSGEIKALATRISVYREDSKEE